jgi:hypothetical protein
VKFEKKDQLVGGNFHSLTPSDLGIMYAKKDNTWLPGFTVTFYQGRIAVKGRAPQLLLQAPLIKQSALYPTHCITIA